MTAPAIGTRVRVHYNLEAIARGLPGVWTVTVRGKAINVTEICLSDCKPVYWRGRDGSGGRKPTGQWLSTHGGKRTVHAWIEGVVCAVPATGARVAITYNPKRSDKFHERATGKTFQSAAHVHFTARDGAVAIA